LKTLKRQQSFNVGKEEVGKDEVRDQTGGTLLKGRIEGNSFSGRETQQKKSHPESQRPESFVFAHFKKTGGDERRRTGIWSGGNRIRRLADTVQRKKGKRALRDNLY